MSEKSNKQQEEQVFVQEIQKSPPKIIEDLVEE